LATTSDHAIVCAQLRWQDGERVKVTRTVTEWDIDGLKQEEETENYENPQKSWEEKSIKRSILGEESREEH